MIPITKPFLSFFWGIVFVQGGDATHAVVQDLRANTTYNVTVAIYNNKDDELQESPTVEGTTSKITLSTITLFTVVQTESFKY